MLSVIIPLKNNLEYTKQAVDSLLSCTKESVELIFIDDGSTDGTREYINQHSFKNKIIFFNSESLGVTKNWNKGIQLSKGEFIAIVNNDIVFTKDWDVPLIQALNEGAWLVSPYHTRFSLPTDFPLGKGRISNANWSSKYEFLGSCFMSHHDLYNKIGLFPEELVLWFNDLWLTQTVEKLGGKIVEIKESYIHHYYSKTIDKEPNLREITIKDEQKFINMGGIVKYHLCEGIWSGWKSLCK